MSKELKDILEKSSKSIEKLQNKVEDFAEELSEEAAEVWQDMKKTFASADEKLKNASRDLDAKGDEANLQAHLGAMEAADKLNSIKDSVEEFTQKVSSKAQTELDTVALRAHLAKMEAKNFWDEQGDTITKDFNESKDKVQKLAVEATSEIKDYFEKLSELFSKKS